MHKEVRRLNEQHLATVEALTLLHQGTVAEHKASAVWLNERAVERAQQQKKEAQISAVNSTDAYAATSSKPCFEVRDHGVCNKVSCRYSHDPEVIRQARRALRDKGAGAAQPASAPGPLPHANNMLPHASCKVAL